jgi:hypothetical protein
MKSNWLFTSGSIVDCGNHARRSATVGVYASPTLYTRPPAEGCVAQVRQQPQRFQQNRGSSANRGIFGIDKLFRDPDCRPVHTPSGAAGLLRQIRVVENGAFSENLFVPVLECFMRGSLCAIRQQSRAQGRVFRQQTFVVRSRLNSNKSSVRAVHIAAAQQGQPPCTASAANM